MKEMEKSFKASEVKLVYKNKVKVADRFKIKGPEDAAHIFFEIWNFEIMDFLEEAKILLLNRAHHVLGIVNLCTGGSIRTIIDTKVVLQYALKANATAIIIAHNHPSGNLKPSEADIKITNRLRTALDTCEIDLLDHLIINSEKQYYSLESDQL